MQNLKNVAPFLPEMLGIMLNQVSDLKGPCYKVKVNKNLNLVRSMVHKTFLPNHVKIRPLLHEI